MNTLIKLIVVAMAFVTSNAMAQEFQGIATYKSHRQMNIQLDSTQMNSEMHQRMMAMMMESFRGFEFPFPLSLWKEYKGYDEYDNYYIGILASFSILISLPITLLCRILFLVEIVLQL